MRTVRFALPPNFLASDPDGLEARIVGAVEQYLVGSGANAAGRSSVHRDLQVIVRSAMEDAAPPSMEGRTRDVTLLLADVRGFTSIAAEAHPLPRVAETLRRHFSTMCDVIYRHGGTVDTFGGDCLMALFVTPVRLPTVVESAICCAIELRLSIEAFNQATEGIGLPRLHMGIGINTGEVPVGRVGAELHREVTEIGNEVHLASQIEACGSRGQILISENCLTRVRPGFLRVSQAIQVPVKGKCDPVCLYEVLSLGPPRSLEGPERDVRRSLRVSVEVPFRFRLCEGQVVGPPRHEGMVRKIGIEGMQATTAACVQPHLTLKFRLRHRALGLETGDIYGKILDVRPEGTLRTVHVEFVGLAPEDRQAIGALVQAAPSFPPGIEAGEERSQPLLGRYREAPAAAPRA